MPHRQAQAGLDSFAKIFYFFIFLYFDQLQYLLYIYDMILLG